MWQLADEGFIFLTIVFLNSAVGVTPFCFAMLHFALCLPSKSLREREGEKSEREASHTFLLFAQAVSAGEGVSFTAGCSAAAAVAGPAEAYYRI